MGKSLCFKFNPLIINATHYGRNNKETRNP